jgi:hypothetical protein
MGNSCYKEIYLSGQIIPGIMLPMCNLRIAHVWSFVFLLENLMPIIFTAQAQLQSN